MPGAAQNLPWQSAVSGSFAASCAPWPTASNIAAAMPEAPQAMASCSNTRTLYPALLSQ